MNKASISKNFFFNTSYQLISIVIPLITTPYLTRTIGAKGVGEYGYELSIATLFMIFIKLGLSNYGCREIASISDDKNNMSKTFWSIFYLQLSTMLIVTSFYLCYVILLNNTQLISKILILYVISSGLDITWFYWGVEDFKYTVLIDCIIKIITTLSVFLFVKNDTDVWIYALIMSIGALTSQMLLLYGSKSRVTYYKPRIDEILKHLKPNLILFFPVIAVSIYSYIDKIMLGFMTNKIEVGYYESSEKILRIPIILVTSLGTVMLPRMSNINATSKDDRKANTIIENSLLFASFLSTLLGYVMMSVSQEFVPLFYGQGFEKCVKLFLILLPSCFFMSVANVIRTQYLIPKQFDKVYVLSVFTGAITNLIFNYLFIPRFHSVGAAAGTLVAEVSVCLVQCMAICKIGSIRHSLEKCLVFPFAGGMVFFIMYRVSLINMSSIMGLLLKCMIAFFLYIIILTISVLSINYLIPNTYNYMKIKNMRDE